jgi:hypothetical protein
MSGPSTLPHSRIFLRILHGSLKEGSDRFNLRNAVRMNRTSQTPKLPTLVRLKVGFGSPTDELHLLTRACVVSVAKRSAPPTE